MTKLSLGSHPYMLGFEQLERLLERSAKSGNEGYPPFNIEQTSQNSYRITLAVAGFGKADSHEYGFSRLVFDYSFFNKSR